MLSVIIPTLNAARQLPDCLAALRLYPDAIEIIVVDGGSSDDTAQIAARCGTRLLTAEAGRARQMIAGAGLPVPTLLAEAAKTGEPAKFFHHPSINAGRFFVAG